VVISGDRDALQAAMDLAAAAGARKVVLLPITIAAHSPLMASAAEAFARDVAATPVSAPNMPVIANLTAGPLQKPAEIRAELAGQLTGGVQWTASMRYLREQEVETFVEVGPGDVLDKLMKRIDRAAVRQRFTELD
jgi:[acyl-carrier-protein] S-malonyltransferase